jgi:hypothetical protein
MAQLLVFGVDGPQTADALHRDHPVGSTDPSALERTGIERRR